MVHSGGEVGILDHHIQTLGSCTLCIRPTPKCTLCVFPAVTLSLQYSPWSPSNSVMTGNFTVRAREEYEVVYLDPKMSLGF